MPALVTPHRLYILCLDRLVPWLTKVGETVDWDDTSTPGPLENLGTLVEDLLIRAYISASRGRILQQGAGSWKDDWRVFFNKKLRRAVLPWDRKLLLSLGETCTSLLRVLVSRWAVFSPDDLTWLPTTVMTLDFDGELFYRGHFGPDLEFSKERPLKGWLAESAAILMAMHTSRQKVQKSDPPIPSSTHHSLQLTELHLGTVQMTHAQLRAVLQLCPNLRLLRHYQLVTALYLQHGGEWRRGESLPVYKLRNLDADFSHVVRCRMSPDPVLAPDAMHLATRLCPDTIFVRVRYDCETPHDVLSSLTGLRKLRELSVVCVSSGQRSLLDFSDLTPILEHHGKGLHSLELKVIEEVDVHVILSSCPRLERLVLSGCGNVTPPSCPSYNCTELKLRKLRLLFFADGDDFSWDHDVPQCFWKATLGKHARRGDTTDRQRLEGLFLESPRIPPGIAADIFRQAPDRTPVFPELQVLSLCRCPEVTVEHLAAMCGLDTGQHATRPRRVTTTATSLRYIRLAQCEQVGEREEQRLRNMLQQLTISESIVLVVNVTTTPTGTSRPPHHRAVTRPPRR